MPFPREVLNEIKWREHALQDAQVVYLHRGAPGDLMSISGKDIVGLERSFFVTADSKIPYHRIRRIVLRGRVIWEAAESTMEKEG